jgi:hypothetical protein
MLRAKLRKLTALFSILLVTCTLLLCLPWSSARVQLAAPSHLSDLQPAESASPRGVEIIQDSSYPELHVDGKPFFIHSAAFFYYRIPRDLWSRSLARHRDLGINTIDLYIPWNWHEPHEGEIDFDGHSNPRRDLRGLLQLISEKGLKLIVRPGPVILNEWRHGGYPEWLLERPEYKMDLVDRLEGRYAPLSNLNARDAEAAARGWLENETHMHYTRMWLAAVARELVPFGARKTLRVRVPARKQGEFEEKEISGPLLFVQLDDDMAIGRTNYAGPLFWQYMNELRKMLESAGLDVPSYINPTDMRVSAAGFALARPIGAMGQWYLQPPQSVTDVGTTEKKISAHDASTIEFYADSLKTQPAFPPVIIEYQAAWYTPGDDSQAFESPVANTLLSSRLLLAHGLHGLNYFPAQDTITPAGFSTPWTNRYYRWDAALDAAANRQSRFRAITRNGMLVDAWGTFLASSHKRADFGLVNPLGAYPQEPLTREEIMRVSQAVLRISRVAELAGFSSELLDPHYQPVEQFLRYPLVLLPVFDLPGGKLQLSEKAQRVLVDYVRRGGTLIYFPARPTGRIAEEFWKSSTAISPSGFSQSQDQAVSAGWMLGYGRIFESTKDFFSWVSLDESISENRARFESTWALGALRGIVERANVRPTLQVVDGVAGSAAPPGELVVTQLVSNAGSEPFGVRRSGSGLLSVTNLNYETSADLTIKTLSPRASARSGSHASENDLVQLSVVIPAHEALFLPLHQPICSAARPDEKCEDEVITAGAELVWAERSGKTLELTFYTPARATVALHLEREPSRVSVDEDIKPETRWDKEKRRLEVDLLRGASPDFLRVLKINLPYTPKVPEKPDPSKQPHREFEFAVVDAVRLPLTETASLPSDPPLVILDENWEGKVLMQGSTFEEFGRDIDFTIEGPIRGSGYVVLEGHDTRQTLVNLKPQREVSSVGNPSRNDTALTNGLLRGELQIRSGRDHRTTPILFAVVGESRVASYEFDFDRDGAPERVLENSSLRLIVSPADGGRAVALVDKTSGLNLTTNVGAFRDHFLFTPNLPKVRPDRVRGRYGLFNRPYHADWVPGEEGDALRLTYDAPDVFPAGARIVKTVRLPTQDTLAVDYDVVLKADSVDTALSGRPQPEQAFVAVNSVPAVFGGDRTTQFCWPGTPPAVLPSSPDSDISRMQCAAFAPSHEALVLPERANRLEIRSPGRLAMALEWKLGRMTIEMKNFSALLKLQFPTLSPGGSAGQYQVRFHVLPAD